MKLRQFAFLACLFLTLSVAAQKPAATTTGVTDLCAIGPSYSASTPPSVSGTILCAHQATSSSYSFAVLDVVPESVKPFNAVTNLGVGMAQQVGTFGRVTMFFPTSVGISFSGASAGWQWNSGLLAAIPVKRLWIMPMARFVKSSVSGGSSYQPIFGVLIGLRK